MRMWKYSDASPFVTGNMFKSNTFNYTFFLSNCIFVIKLLLSHVTSYSPALLMDTVESDVAQEIIHQIKCIKLVTKWTNKLLQSKTKHSPSTHERFSQSEASVIKSAHAVVNN